MSNKREVVVKLSYPFEWADEDGKREVSEVKLSRPKGKHLKKLSKDMSMDDLFYIASKVSGYTPAFFDEMDAVDCLKITEAIGDFLDVGGETGKTV